ncbi:hypothetical protein DCO58_07140 [Helicobacter saguini]|uniref:Tetratricopeptide repeat-like domain-containing protein n=1 Tax=Helicobacter saguini TaxID=1548018 RepID=A0A347VWU0_9HELI|nr:hypothetical protein [Helicobacter saguini]MWV61892.1 hypothetical protein [Helicobacter saguini]MWV67433.1 hypothetical protein [Helicobacter saguini]MWV69786.1 hypothetical protein [Helicobacter saguini]MWV72997.1 hypothetical protein [Helicobacter saguini]TLD95623.1 hypothetical protein LS64_001860 [Helicobacter saguini]
MAREQRVENNLERNLQEVKDKLASDQNMLFNAFALESFYKKYKIWIFVAVAVIIGVIAYFSISAFVASHHKEKMVEIMNEINAKDVEESRKEQLLGELQKQDSILYDFYMFENLQKLSPLEIKDSKNLEILKSLMQSKDPLIADFASYQYGVFTESLDILESHSFATSPLLKDRARFFAAYLHLQKGEIALAHALLNSITKRDDNEQIYELATLLKHYGLDSIESNLQNSIKDSKNSTQDSKDSKELQNSEENIESSFNIYNLDSKEIIESSYFLKSKIDSKNPRFSKQILKQNIESNLG